MAQKAFQAVVDSAEEAEFFRAFLVGQHYEVDVKGPFAKAIFDLKDVSTGTVVKALICWIITGIKQAL